MERLRTTILGTKIDAVTKAEALSRIRKFLKAGQHHLVTPNAEFILQARRDKKFQAVLNEADLALLDGSGPKIASQFTSIKLPEIIPGSDMVQDILSLANESHMRVAVLNIDDSLSPPDEIEQVVEEKYPHLSIIAVPVPRADMMSAVMLSRLKEFRPEILFVAYGSPNQDFWIHLYLPELPMIRVAMGIGGSFDFLTGQRSRAPMGWRRVGLEWLWRLFTKPKGGEYRLGSRLKKIFRSVIVFPIVFVFTLNRG